ncbi:MAG: hypothetical protein QG643_973, partial [Pseudomonadota bacterium]|nr:hypothetical protein [Pseudomonadota bacterium]
PNQAMLINTIPLLEAKDSSEIENIVTTTDPLLQGNLADKGIAQRQAASRYLHDLAALGVLHEVPFGKEKLFIHPKLMQLLGRDNNQFQLYA